MRRSYKFLLRPTSKQNAALSACLGGHRELYNAALEHRRTAYRKADVTMRYGDQSTELKHIRAEDPTSQGRWSFSSQPATLRRLDKAMSCDDVPAEPLPATSAAAGIDMGVASLITTSDGEHLDNPRNQAASAGRLRFACTACGHTAHADVNAAINILGAGLALRETAEAA